MMPANMSSGPHGISQPILLRPSCPPDLEVVETSVHVGPQTYSMLRINDTNALIDGLDPVAFLADERLPYWAELWPASVELARWCIEDAHLEGAMVLDLGCGLGLAGIAALNAGASVIFADYEEDAIEFTRHNVHRNVAPSIAHTRATFRVLDWRHDNVLPVDCILGADIVYERRNFDHILAFVHRSLKPGGVAVLTDPDRSTGMSFFARAEKEGFDVRLDSTSLMWMGASKTILRGEMTLKRKLA